MRERKELKRRKKTRLKNWDFNISLKEKKEVKPKNNSKLGI